MRLEPTPFGAQVATVHQMTVDECIADAEGEAEASPAAEGVDGDPNEDLLGFEFPVEFGIVRVVGTTAWNKQYVDCEYIGAESVKTCRPAGLVRNHKRMDAATASVLS